MKKLLQIFMALALLALLVGQALAAPIGQVTALVPGAFVDRDGQEIALDLNASIEAKDTLRTDASGRVQILFADNSSVTLGSNTTMSMEEFAFDDGEPAFKAHLGQGLMRVITGAIVEQNPKGFAVTTPEAHIGIRGTIITVLSKDGFTTVWVENTTRQVIVNNIDVPSGEKITVPSTPPLIEKITPEDREFIIEETAILVARAAPRNIPDMKPDIASVPLSVQTAGDALSGTPTPAPTTATITGSLAHGPTALGWNVQTHSGTFTATVTLASGNVTSFSLSAGGAEAGADSYSYTASGGSGFINSTGINITGFTGTITGTGLNGAPIDNTSTLSGGPADISAVGNPVSGSYDIYASGSALSSGTFTGSRTQ